MEEKIRKNHHGVNIVKAYYLHLWKCHDDTAYYV
jgi:hypothetical protein